MSTGLWFRFYTRTVNNAKVQALPDKLFKAWVNILCLAKDNDGKVPELSAVAFALRYTDAAAHRTLLELERRNLLVRISENVGGDVTFQPHNWNEHQYVSDVSTSRVRAFRERKRNVSETPSETETETETEQRHTQSGFVRWPKPPQKPKPEASLRFPEFWKRYPLKDVAENLSAGVWLGLVTIDVEAAVFSCLERYLASDQVARGVVKSPNNWLHDCARANWECVWPAAQPANGSGKPAARRNMEPLSAIIGRYRLADPGDRAAMEVGRSEDEIERLRAYANQENQKTA